MSKTTSTDGRGAHAPGVSAGPAAGFEASSPRERKERSRKKDAHDRVGSLVQMETPALVLTHRSLVLFKKTPS